MDIKQVVILGASGFIGSAIREFLKIQGIASEIIAISSSEVDLTNLKEVYSLKKYFKKTTAILMCSNLKRNVGDNLDTFLGNMSMCENLCVLLQDHHVGRFIYFSSAAVYGEEINNVNITETTNVCPMTYYGIAKYSSECLFRKAISSHGKTSFIIFRPSIVYGSNDRSNSYGPSEFINSNINSNEIVLWGDGEELRDFIYIKDVAKIVIKMIFNKFDGIINLSSGSSHTFQEVVELSSCISNTKTLVSSRKRTKEKVNHIYNNSLLNRLLPNYQYASLEEGMKDTFISLTKK